jgi:hypothetical protein
VRDPTQLVKSVVEPATKQPPPDDAMPPNKSPAAVELGRLGGLKGGKARAAKLAPETRSDIARKAAAARWKW